MERKSPVRQERADARRNREKILRAAQLVVAERGSDASLDEIARRAGVGAGTLYRRFPDRSSLLRAVAYDAVQAVADEVDAAWVEESEAFAMLSRCMHVSLSVRIGPVMAALLDEGDLWDELVVAQEGLLAKVEVIVDRAHAEGSLREDVAAGDLGVLVGRLARPWHGSLPDQLDDELAHRHLEIMLAGMRTAPGRCQSPLSGAALDLVSLRQISVEGLRKARARREASVSRAVGEAR